MVGLCVDVLVNTSPGDVSSADAGVGDCAGRRVGTGTEVVMFAAVVDTTT